MKWKLKKINQDFESFGNFWKLKLKINKSGHLEFWEFLEIKFLRWYLKRKLGNFIILRI